MAWPIMPADAGRRLVEEIERQVLGKPQRGVKHAAALDDGPYARVISFFARSCRRLTASRQPLRNQKGAAYKVRGCRPRIEKQSLRPIRDPKSTIRNSSHSRRASALLRALALLRKDTNRLRNARNGCPNSRGKLRLRSAPSLSTFVTFSSSSDTIAVEDLEDLLVGILAAGEQRASRVRQFSIVACAFAAALFAAARAEAVVQGIDVSHWQGAIDWTAVRNSGIQFAYCKVSDGVGDFDATYATNLSGARAAGVLVGPYHFAYPDTNKTDPNDAANEANYFVDLIKPYYQGAGVMLRPVLDLERLSGQATVADEKAFLSKWVHNFAAVVETRLGVSPIVYTSGNYAQNYYDGTPPPISADGKTGYDIDQYPLWFAKPTSTNDYSQAVAPTVANMGIWGSGGKTWKFWQWSWVGAIGGIAGNVDRDVWAGSLLELAQQFSPNYSNGDYNNNGVVDAADYVLWRNTFGQTINPGVGADGDLSGSIDAGDFTIWKTNYGKLVPNVPAGAGAGLAPVPEPASIILAVAALAAMATVRRRR